MTTSLLEQVRAGCRAVATHARDVRIAEDRLDDYAASLPLAAAPPAPDPRFNFRGSPEATARFVLTLDAINFGSGYFPHLRKPAGLSGYFTIASALTERFSREGAFTAAELQALSPADCAIVFGQDLTDGPITELMVLFARALNDLGDWLDRRFVGEALAAVGAADGSAARLVELLTEMPFFRDVATYDRIEIPFYKRAQLTVADLALAFAGQGPGRFTDLDRLTMFADNLVPHVLRVDGILRYDPALAARIDAGDPIPAGSSAEIEIRASALHAVECLVAARQRQGHPTTAMHLDFLLWNRGQQPAYKARPRHRTRGFFY